MVLGTSANFYLILGQWDTGIWPCFRALAGVRALGARVRAPSIMVVKFQFLARGLWYLVLVPTST